MVDLSVEMEGWLCLSMYKTALLYLTSILCLTQEFFTYTTLASIMVEANRVVPKGKPTTIQTLQGDLPRNISSNRTDEYQVSKWIPGRISNFSNCRTVKQSTSKTVYCDQIKLMIFTGKSSLTFISLKGAGFFSFFSTSCWALFSLVAFQVLNAFIPCSIAGIRQTNGAVAFWCQDSASSNIMSFVWPYLGLHILNTCLKKYLPHNTTVAEDTNWGTCKVWNMWNYSQQWFLRSPRQEMVGAWSYLLGGG